jgi:hypothetical protein
LVINFGEEKMQDECQYFTPLDIILLCMDGKKKIELCPKKNWYLDNYLEET